MAQSGFLITVEGVEGAGKTTQANRLAAALDTNVIVTREPGGTAISERIRDIFLNSDGIMPTTELLLIAAARVQHVSEIIRPALEANKIVICDRFIDASIAYQGYRGGIDITLIKQLNKIATEDIRPALTFLLDLSPEVGIQRQFQRHQNRLDREPLEYHRKVREGYLAIAKAEPERVKVIDGALCRDVIHNKLLTACKKHGIPLFEIPE